MSKSPRRRTRRTPPPGLPPPTAEEGLSPPAIHEGPSPSILDEGLQKLVDIGLLRDWDRPWQVFLGRHEYWWQRYGATDPVYTLPLPVLEALCASTPAKGRQRCKQSLLSDAEKWAERAFNDLCSQFNADLVGAWEGRPIEFPYFSSRLKSTTWIQRAIPRLEERRAERRGTVVDSTVRLKATQAGVEAANRSSEIDHQLTAYIGWLTLNEQYRAERAALQGEWSSLGSPRIFPLHPATLLRVRPVTSNALKAFVQEVKAFLRKWQLIGLATWDLPLPQGPTILPGSQVGRLSPDQVAICVPTYFDIRANRQFHDRIVEQQRALAGTHGITTEFPLTDLAPRRNPATSNAAGMNAFSASETETIFRLWFVEQTMRARYADRRGLTTRFRDGVLEWLAGLGQTISIGHFNRLRRGYHPAGASH